MSLFRAEEQQNEARDLALRSRREDDERQHHEAVPLPCPRLSGHIRPHVAKPAQELNPVRKEEMKQNEEGKENVVSMMTLWAKAQTLEQI